MHLCLLCVCFAAIFLVIIEITLTNERANGRKERRADEEENIFT
jgi:hypothetical protein